MKNLFRSMKLIPLLLVSNLAFADSVKPPPVHELPILVIGASYSSGKLPLDDNFVSPLFGIAVNGGSYLDLGSALTRNKKLPGFVINEANAGATTFARLGCNPGPACGPGGWVSYSTQLQKSLARVALPTSPVSYNAKYVVITIANDCLHSDAFGIPQSQAVRCSTDDINNYVDRLISVGQEALAKGLTPVFDLYPDYNSLDLELTRTVFGLAWVVNEAEFNQIKNIHESRITTELPGALVVDMWKGFTHIGEGLHPSPETSKKAAKRIVKAIKNN